MARDHLNDVIVNHYGRSNMYANTRGGGCSHALESAPHIYLDLDIQHSIFSAGQERTFFSLAFIMMTHLPYFASGKVNIKFGVRSKSPPPYSTVYQTLRYDHFSQQKVLSCLCLPRVLQCTSQCSVRVPGPGPGAWCPHLTEAGAQSTSDIAVD